MEPFVARPSGAASDLPPSFLAQPSARTSPDHPRNVRRSFSWRPLCANAVEPHPDGIAAGTQSTRRNSSPHALTITGQLQQSPPYSADDGDQTTGAASGCRTRVLAALPSLRRTQKHVLTLRTPSVLRPSVVYTEKEQRENKDVIKDLLDVVASGSILSGAAALPPVAVEEAARGPAVDPCAQQTAEALQQQRSHFFSSGHGASTPLSPTVVGRPTHPRTDSVPGKSSPLAAERVGYVLQDAPRSKTAPPPVHLEDDAPEALASKKHAATMKKLEEFLVALLRALHLYGCPSHILEFHMAATAKGLGHTGAVFAIFPTYALVSFERPDDPDGPPHRSTHYFGTTYGLNMHKLQLVDEVARRVASYATNEAPVGVDADESIQELHDSMAQIVAASTPKAPAARPGRARSSFARLSRLFGQTDGGGVREPAASDGASGNSSCVAVDAMGFDAAPHCVVSFQPDEKTGNSCRQTAESLPQPAECAAPSDNDVLASIKKTILVMASQGPGFFSNPGSSAPPSPVPSRPESTCFTPESPTHSPVNGDAKLPKKFLRREKKAREKKAKDLANLFTTLAVEDALSRLLGIVNDKPLYPQWLLWLAAGVASAGCAGMNFGGSGLDMIVSFLIGAFLQAMCTIASKSENLSRVYEFLAAFFVGAVVTTLVHCGLPMCYGATTLASLIWFLQGFTLTLAVVELVTRNMFCGISRLSYGLITTGVLGYGLYMGNSVTNRIFGRDYTFAQPCAAPISPYWYFLLFVPTVISNCMLVQAHPRQFPPMVSAAAIGYVISYAGATFVGPNQATLVAAFVAGVYSNVLAKVTGKPAIVPELAALLMLVPGSMAVRSFSAFLGDDNTAGTSITMSVLSVTLSLGIGLFLSSLVVTPQERFKFFLHVKQSAAFVDPDEERKRILRNMPSLHF